MSADSVHAAVEKSIAHTDKLGNFQDFADAVEMATNIQHLKTSVTGKTKQQNLQKWSNPY
jgi:hypothetical protein